MIRTEAQNLQPGDVIWDPNVAAYIGTCSEYLTVSRVERIATNDVAIFFAISDLRTHEFWSSDTRCYNVVEQP